MAQCQGPRAQMVTLFLVFTYTWQQDVAIIPENQGPRARQIQPGQYNNMITGVTIYCTIFQKQFTSTS